MRNLKRLSAAVLIVALVLTSMTAVFAADSATLANADNAMTLKDLGLYSGQDANDPKVGLENALTTQDSLIFLSKLFGYNDAANALSADQVAEALAKFDDAASISDYAKNVVAYSATNSILSGMTDGQRFFVGAEDTVTAARFATFMLKQMGYTVADYKASVAKLAETKGSKVDATVTGDLTRDAAVGVMYGALTAEKASGKTVIADIVGDNADLKAKAEKLGLLINPVTADVAVESVKALNCKQIQVVFNQEMDRDSVETEEFYEILDKGENKVELGDDSASLDSDKKTVTITLNKNVADKLTNSSEAKVIVKKDIKAKSGAKLDKNAIYDKVEVQDGIIPTVTKAEHTGECNIRITFSEPVYDKGNDNSIANANFKVVSGTYEYFVQEATLDNNVINLVLGTKLIEGPITVTVNNAGSDKSDAIVDYAGYAVFKGSTTFNYVKDTSVSVVTVKSANKDKVVLHFSKPIKGTDIKLYHSVKNSIYVAKATTDKLTNEITFTYGNTPLPQGSVKLFLVNSGVDDYKLVDGYGIKVPDQTLTCEIVIDETAPVFISGEFDKDVSITLTFDEELDWDSAKNTGNYKIEKVIDNTVISFSAEKDPDKEATVTLKPNPKLDDNTEYQVTIKKAQDIYGNKSTKEYTYTFTTGDNNPPRVIEDSKIDPHCSAIPQDGKITIVYSEPMNESQMLDKANYMVSFDGGRNYKILGDGDSITKVNDRTVIIYIKELDNKNNPNIGPYVKIAPIMDLAGKRLYNKVDPYIVKFAGADPAVVTVKSAKENKVVLGFSKPVKGTNIMLYYNNELYRTYATKTYYTNEIEFRFNNPLPIGGLGLYLVNSGIESEKLVDNEGIFVPDQTLSCVVEAPPAPPAPSTPSDTTPPAVVGTPVVNSSTSITITFNESLDRTTAIDTASYTIKKLPDNIELPFIADLDDSMRSVVLTLSTPLADNTDYLLIINRCKDLYGNMSSPNQEFNIIPPVYNVDIIEAQLIAKDRIKVVFNKKMARINISDFFLTTPQDDKVYIVDSEFDPDDPDGKTIFLKPGDNLGTDATVDGIQAYLSTVEEPTSSSERGIKLRQPEPDLELEDKAAPEIIAVVTDADSYDSETHTVAQNTTVSITISFTEAVEITESENAVYLFNVAGFTVTDIIADTFNKIIILTVRANEDPTNVLTSVTVTEDEEIYNDINIYDGKDNVLELTPGSSWPVTFDHSAN